MNENNVLISLRVLVLVSLCILLVGCSAEVNPADCIMNVKQGNTNIPNGSGYFNFGSIPLGFSQSITFTIENLGVLDLNLTGSPKVDIEGQDASAFKVFTNQTKSTIQPMTETTFLIHFKPTNSGNNNATVLIANDDNVRNPYTFTVNGNGTQPAPEIHVKQDTTDILCITGLYDFNIVDVNSESEKVEFTIENNGNKDLTLIGNQEKISVTGTNATSFKVFEDNIQTIITGGNSTKFYVWFAPTSPGTKTAKISILNDDSDENPYTFTITGTAVSAPEINVKQDSNNIINGSGRYGFANTIVSESSQEITFIIENSGTSALNIESIGVSGSDKSMFHINDTMTDSSILPGDFTTFTITFKPTALGSKTAIISVVNDDNDENPYTFTIEAKGVSPEINVKQDMVNIPNGTGTFDLGIEYVNIPGLEYEFTVENSGDGDLKLTDTAIVDITGPNASEFAVNTVSTQTTINPGDSTTFFVKCNPTSIGNKTASVSIANNDLDENPYVFTIKCNAITYVKGDVNGDGYTDIIVSAPNDDDGGNYSGCAFIFFGKQNWNPTVDVSNADVTIVGEFGNSRFGTSLSMAGDINKDGYEDIIISTWQCLSFKGRAYVFLGRNQWKSSYNGSEADIQITGSLPIYFGYCVSGVDDVNKDGIDDILIGATADDSSGNNSGRAFIFFGRMNWSSTYVSNDADVKISGAISNEQLGNTVSNAGDINNDGINDIIVSSSDYVYIFLGRKDWSGITNAAVADVTLTAENSNDRFGLQHIGIGDINFDGYDDIAIAAPRASYNGDRSGRLYIFFGRQTWNSSMNASAADMKFDGTNPGDYLGLGISNKVDLNNDGKDDLCIGTGSSSDANGLTTGCAYVFFGRSNWSSVSNLLQYDVLLYGKNWDGFGDCISSAGDVNKDGINDIIIGADTNDEGGLNAGAVYVFHGRQSWPSTFSALNAEVEFIGGDSNDNFGYCVDGQ